MLVALSFSVFIAFQQQDSLLSFSDTYLQNKPDVHYNLEQLAIKIINRLIMLLT